MKKKKKNQWFRRERKLILSQPNQDTQHPTMAFSVNILSLGTSSCYFLSSKVFPCTEVLTNYKLDSFPLPSPSWISLNNLNKAEHGSYFPPSIDHDKHIWRRLRKCSGVGLSDILWFFPLDYFKQSKITLSVRNSFVGWSEIAKELWLSWDSTYLPCKSYFNYSFRSSLLFLMDLFAHSG